MLVSVAFVRLTIKADAVKMDFSHAISMYYQGGCYQSVRRP